MKVKYEIEEISCITPCPHGMRGVALIKVNSISCQRCMYYVSDNGREIECALESKADL
jgi:hypothetical protein